MLFRYSNEPLIAVILSVAKNLSAASTQTALRFFLPLVFRMTGLVYGRDLLVSHISKARCGAPVNMVLNTKRTPNRPDLFMNRQDHHAACLFPVRVADDVWRDDDDQLRDVIFGVLVGRRLEAGKLAESGQAGDRSRLRL